METTVLNEKEATDKINDDNDFRGFVFKVEVRDHGVNYTRGQIIDEAMKWIEDKSVFFDDWDDFHVVIEWFGCDWDDELKENKFRIDIKILDEIN